MIRRFFFILLLMFIFLNSPAACAGDIKKLEFKLFNYKDLTVAGGFLLPDIQADGVNFSTVDLGGDGTTEILVGAGSGDLPEVKIFTNNGDLVNTFLAYDKKFKGGVSVWGEDLDGDGQGEIIVGALAGGGPHARVFDGYGREKINAGFFAFDQKYSGGIKVAAGDINGDGSKEIIVASGRGLKPEVKIFDLTGKYLNSIYLQDINSDYGFNLSMIDLGGDGIAEIVVGAGYKNHPQVQIYRGDGSLINEFLVFSKDFMGGVNVAAADINNDGKGEVIVGTGIGGEPQVKIVDGFGKEVSNWRAFSGDYRTGVKVLAGRDSFRKPIIVTMPDRWPIISNLASKLVDVDLSDQRLHYYDHGILIDDQSISTGAPGRPTRTGDFHVLTKLPMAYGGVPGQSWKMPYWVGFYTSGSLENGFHALPYLNGRKESAKSLGRPLSHGCIRMGDEAAKRFYNWVNIGDEVVVRN